jgi:anti-anti-sigma factor
MPHVRKPTVAAFRLTERDIWPGCREVKVEGELDLAVSDELRSALDRAVIDGLDVLIDLAACDFIDVSGVTVLVQGDEDLTGRGRHLLLSGVQGQIRRVLRLTGLTGAKHGIVMPLEREAKQATGGRAEERAGPRIQRLEEQRSAPAQAPARSRGAGSIA